MKLVYTAGPFRGKTAWDVESNVRVAENYALCIARLGAMPVCPHANTRFFHGQIDEQFWVYGTLRLLEVCDAMVLIPGWERSVGARGERARFEKWGRGDKIFDLSDLGIKDGFVEEGAELDRLHAYIKAS